MGIASEEEAREAFQTIVDNARQFDAHAEIRGVLVQQMADSGQEVIMGVSRYPVFGHLIMFGLGGVFVEIFKDVVFRLAPLTRNSARRMIREIKGFKLLRGFRGREKADIAILERLIVGLSDMVGNHPEIKELDINPLLVHAQKKGATVADCRIILEPLEKANDSSGG